MIRPTRIEVAMLLELHEPDANLAVAPSYNDAALAALGVARDDAASTRVAIGLVDYGFDLLHPTLLDPVTRGSRFRCLWDQNRTPAAARSADLDVAAVDDFDRAILDREVQAAIVSGSRRRLDAIYDPYANNCGRGGTIGGAHGTMMESIAAGTGVAGFRGAAPAAELIGVQLALLDHDWKEQDPAGRPTWSCWRPDEQPVWEGWKSYDDSRQIINAVRYIHDRGRRLGVGALVINLSIGAWAGSHAGLSSVEHALGEMLADAEEAWLAGRGPRTVLVAGTGNAGVDEGHWHGEAKAGHPATFDWIMQRRDPTQNKLEIWYDGETATADITLGSPRGPMVPIDPGATRELVIAGVRVGTAEHRVGMRGRLSCVRLLIHPPFLPAAALAVGADTFAATLRVASADATRINAWIERDDGAIERSWLSPSHPSGSLCCLATVPHALVVAGYDHHRDTVDRWPALLPASSLGPAPWGDGAGGRVPHFAAPARCIWGARSKSQGFVETTGTSAAVALVSGAIAHHLGVHGAGAPLPARAGEWSPRFGYGRFRIDASDCTGVDQ
jgi:hypothetical protein